MKLTSENVDTVFRDSLFKNDENTDNYVKGVGIKSDIGFHPDRLESHRDDVKTMLACLPDAFMRTAGGGMSFLNACNDRDGVQWTGMHQHMEQLFQLGDALGLSKYPMPKEAWHVLPGGMPYILVLGH